MEEPAKTITGTGLERVREILFGEILVELERRLAKLENYIASRSNDVQHDARQRMEVLEGHIKKEVEAVAGRATRDSTEISGEIREVRHQQHEALVEIEQRFVRSEERLQAQIALVERESREQLLANAKTFFEELVQMRSELRLAAARNEEEEEVERPSPEGTEHVTMGAH
jgi:hypothetical protein